MKYTVQLEGGPHHGGHVVMLRLEPRIHLPVCGPPELQECFDAVDNAIVTKEMPTYRIATYEIIRKRPLVAKYVP